MSFGIFLQIFANVVFTAALFVIFARLRRPAKDDPRLSKGLQLLSSKIAVLEDLSDRTETQVQQMLLLLDQKSRELQAKIGLAEQQVSLVRQSMQQSLEVAQIFQDKIPHSEIIERQNSVKYIKAARLAHAGVSVNDIAREVDLPMGEIEFIVKVNHENLSFREEELPAWAREPQAGASTNVASTVAHQNLAASLTPVTNEQMPVPSVNDGLSATTPAAGASVPPGSEGLVERLNKLQFEMKNLDLELAHRSARNVLPDTTQAFSQPRIESTSLERIGEEFRRAVEQAEQNENGARELRDDSQNDHRSPMKSFAESIARMGMPEPEYAPAPIAASQAAPAAPAFASAKVPISSPAPATAATSTQAPAISPDLEAARAAAAALRARDERARNERAQAPAVTSSNTPIKSVRRVEFPRI